MILGDGLEFFGKHADPRTLSELLGACTIWIDPKCHELLPVWSPYSYRKAPLYKANWKDRQTNKDEPKSEGNVEAGKAQNKYLGIIGTNKESRPNWACCHIWGNDDPSFQADHAEVNDPRYFTCPANMVLVPSPLKTFTDTIPEVKSALRYASSILYGFSPENRDEPDASAASSYLPDIWRKPETIRFVPINDRIIAHLTERVEKLAQLQESAGENYPRRGVAEVISYWKTQKPKSLFSKLLE